MISLLESLSVAIVIVDGSFPLAADRWKVYTSNSQDFPLPEVAVLINVGEDFEIGNRLFRLHQKRFKVIERKVVLYVLDLTVLENEHSV